MPLLRFLPLILIRNLVRAAVPALLLVAGHAAVANAPAIGKIPDEQLYGFIGKDPLPPGTIPWQQLRQVEMVEEKKAGKSLMRPKFSAKMQALDKQEVKLYGFVMPLSTTPKQKHFLISPLPTHCPFCVSQGPDSIVEVLAKIPVEFSQWEPVIVSGRLELVNDSSLFYRLTDAVPVKN
ncbi:MAG: DUF3299 domain-containing protein [Betaproteobacteria bacterium]|nr:DUF3299 domain-containing protein [Betaproteobacteria bacterium]